jgi:hypothetical protein
MKKLMLLTLGVLPAYSTVLWTEDFETYDVGVNNLEAQSNGAWLTDPIETPAIAVIGNSGLPTSLGSKSLAVGGLPTDDSEVTLGVAYALSPTSAGFDPVAYDPEVELSFSVDLILNSGSGQSLVDDFRFSFTDLNGTELATLLFTQDAVEAGSATVIRSNTAGVFATQALIPLNTAFTLNLVMNPLLNKWSGSLTPFDGSVVSLFANVDITQNPATDPAPEATVGSFAIDWIKGGATWGDNFLLADNFTLQSQVPVPEPSVPVLASVFALAGILRRRR